MQDRKMIYLRNDSKLALRWSKYDASLLKICNHAKQLTSNINHSFGWFIICNAPCKELTRKVCRNIP